MRKTFCDKCGKEITEDVTMVFDHELCPECANAVKGWLRTSENQDKLIDHYFYLVGSKTQASSTSYNGPHEREPGVEK